MGSPGVIPSERGKKMALAQEVARVRREEPNTVVLCEDETILREFPPDPPPAAVARRCLTLWWCAGTTRPP